VLTAKNLDGYNIDEQTFYNTYSNQIAEGGPIKIDFNGTVEEIDSYADYLETLVKLISLKHGSNNTKSSTATKSLSDLSSEEQTRLLLALGEMASMSIGSALNVLKFAGGGLADFTGPAWLDGSTSRPEYVLNPEQTERFFTLVDVLENVKPGDGANSKTSGDNYYDISINIEKIEDDYDIEKMADKIRKMIYEDATYRNVNTINHIR
jgi:hypothetical protein